MSRNDLFTSNWSSTPPPSRSRANTGTSTPTTPTPAFAPAPALAPATPSSSKPRPPPIKVDNSAPLSPLHQSPSLAPVDAWKPPLPQFEDVELRLVPSDTYLLGEGRYGRVYLASYRKNNGSSNSNSNSNSNDKGKGKGKGKDPAPGLAPAPEPASSTLTQEDAELIGRVNDSADGLIGGSWRLCAAKRMAPDRLSQTLGLREAFFLNRLKSGSVHVVRLLAVKEDMERRHGRSVSDARAQARDDTSLGGLSLSRLTLLLEHAPLGTLDRMLRTSPLLVTRDMFIKWARQSTEALAWIHSKGVVHADVKPANLLLTASLDLRLSDFGSSLLVHPDHPPTDGVGLGTLPFSSPELVNPNESFSFPADVWALGASLYQCITGLEPYRGLRSVEIMHHVRKGSLWEHEERQRLHRVGNGLAGPGGTSAGSGSGGGAGSPYPSAWRDEGLQRGGSLRVKPKLHRMPSAESLRASDDLVAAQSPAGTKLWARWANGRGLGLGAGGGYASGAGVGVGAGAGAGAGTATGTATFHATVPPPANGPASASAPAPRRSDAISALLAEDQLVLSPTRAELSSPRTEPPSPANPPTEGEGGAEMVFLGCGGGGGGGGAGGSDIVPESIRDVLKSMLRPIQAERPTAEQLLLVWEMYE